MALKQQRRVYEIMTRAPVICCKVDDLLMDVIYMMSLAEVNALLVVDGRNATRGLISQNDILEHYTGLADTRAGQVMSQELVWIGPEETIEQAAHLMMETKALRLLVPDPERPGITAGIVSASDIIRALAAEYRVAQPAKH